MGFYIILLIMKAAAYAALIASVSAVQFAEGDTTPAWGLRTLQDHRLEAQTQIGFGNHATSQANARPPLISHVQLPEQSFYLQTNQEKMEKLNRFDLVQLQADPVTNTCTNANKATGVDEDCSTAGNSAWTTFSSSRTGQPKDAMAPPYPGHALH